MSLFSNLVGCWRLNEPSVVAYSQDGLANMTDNNTVTARAGVVYGNARQFTAANNEYFSLADTAALRLGDYDWTIAALVNPDSHPAATSGIYADLYNDALLVNAYLKMTSTGTLVCGAIKSGRVGQIDATTTERAANGVWTSVFGWVDKTANVIAAQIGQGAVATTAYATISTANNGHYIGRREDDPSHWDGGLQLVCVWTRVLTPPERWQFGRNGLGSPPEAWNASGRRVHDTSRVPGLVAAMPRRGC